LWGWSSSSCVPARMHYYFLPSYSTSFPFELRPPFSIRRGRIFLSKPFDICAFEKPPLHLLSRPLFSLPPPITKDPTFLISALPNSRIVLIRRFFFLESSDLQAIFLLVSVFFLLFPEPERGFSGFQGPSSLSKQLLFFVDQSKASSWEKLVLRRWSPSLFFRVRNVPARWRLL